MRRNNIYFALLIIFSACAALQAQPYPGYTLFGQFNSRNTYLMNLNNSIIKTWTHSKTGGYTAYLLKDGSVIRTSVSSGSSINGGGAQGVLQRYDWNGNLIWEYTYSSNSYRQHHDIEPMPNGNVLIIAWEVKTAAQAIAAGYSGNRTLWPEHILEIQPVGTNGGNIVWKWHFWDHMIQDYDASKANYGNPAQHPELLDINAGTPSTDWIHLNGISYNPELDQIVVSSHYLHEVYVIDHSTTTAEAAGHIGGRWGKGGDILYRWGNPANYRAAGTQVFKVVHNAYWIPKGLRGEGNIMAFNNRENLGNSIVTEITAPVDSAGHYIYTPGTAYGPANPTWSYTAPGFYSNHLGSNQRLPNGNTLMVESTTGFFTEADSLGNSVWTYNRGSEVVRALRYGFDYPGLRFFANSQIAINELHVKNTLFPDSAGEFDPWIEIYNNTDTAIWLDGRYLSDDAAQPGKWRFPDNTLIPARGYFVVWADGDVTQPGLHTNFTLQETGGKLFFANLDRSVIDTISFSVQTENISYGRIPDGTGEFTFTVPTPGVKNTATQPPLPQPLSFMSVTLNEIMSDNDSIPDPSGGFDDWIEFYNTTDSVIDLSGIYITKSPDLSTGWAFPEFTTITPGGYLIVWADADTARLGLHANFTLDHTADALYFLNIDSTVIDSISFGDQVTNISYARLPNGTGSFAAAMPTPGAENQALPVNIHPGETLPAVFSIQQNYPNPFNPETVVRYSLPKAENVTMRIYDILGKEIALVFSEHHDAGEYAVTLNFNSMQGYAGSGIYICRITAGNQSAQIKMSYLK